LVLQNVMVKKKRGGHPETKRQGCANTLGLKRGGLRTERVTGLWCTLLAECWEKKVMARGASTRWNYGSFPVARREVGQDPGNQHHHPRRPSEKFREKVVSAPIFSRLESLCMTEFLRDQAVGGRKPFPGDGNRFREAVKR